MQIQISRYTRGTFWRVICMNANYDRRKVRASHGDDTLMAQVRPELESWHSSTRPKVPTPTS